MASWDYIYNARGKGACCTEILISLQDETITNIKILSGCTGNHAAIQNLVVGAKAQDIIAKLAGTVCQNGTSCPDQLAKALQEALAAKPAEAAAQ